MSIYTFPLIALFEAITKVNSIKEVCIPSFVHLLLLILVFRYYKLIEFVHAVH